MTKQLEALIAKIKKQTESFDTVVLKEGEANTLIAALEQSQKDIEELVTERVELSTALSSTTVRAEKAEKRIAEASPLAVKLPDVKKGEVLVTVAGFTGCGKSAVAGEIEIALRAIGLPVTWANGDEEKRMTGADWLTALEMYKPMVRIVEVNVPRAAGGTVEGE